MRILRPVTVLLALTLVSLISARSSRAQLPTSTLADPVRVETRQAAAANPGGKTDSTRQTPTEETFASRCRQRLADARAQAQPNHVLSVGCGQRWHRLRTSKEADRWFGGPSVGDGVALTVGRGAGSVYTELLADNMWIMAFTGYARVGLGVQASSGAGSSQAADATPNGGAGDSTRTPTTIDQLFQGGGNALLHLTLRGPFWMNYVHDVPDSAPPVRRIDTFLILSTGVDLPELGQDVRRRAGYARAAYTGDFTWRTFADDFRFLTQFSVDLVSGFNKTFFTNLTGSTATTRPGVMGLARLNVGVEVGGLVRITASRGWSTLQDEGIRQPVRLSVQFVKKR